MLVLKHLDAASQLSVERVKHVHQTLEVSAGVAILQLRARLSSVLLNFHLRNTLNLNRIKGYFFVDGSRFIHRIRSETVLEGHQHPNPLM